MIRLIEALNFRCLRYVRQPLGRFHVLVGPNASGKTTFLDVVAFLGEMVTDGLEEALESRTRDFRDLLWRREGEAFELAIEAEIPDERKALLPPSAQFDTIRYEVRIGLIPNLGEVGILDELAFLKQWKEEVSPVRPLFPMEPNPAKGILSKSGKQGVRRVLSKKFGGNDNFYSEVLEEGGKGWFPSIKLGPHKSALKNLPEDESRFPVSTWLKKQLAQGVQRFMLDSLLMRRASPPGKIHGFKPDGSNLPWVVEELKQADPGRFEQWILHLRTALPDIKDIRTVLREDDRHRYLIICYQGGLEVPSWMASDGTLRLLALTLPAYLSGFRGVYLIEEPENGIHPRAVETLYQSLSSVYDAQILLATHSPVILSAVSANDVLCFAKTNQGATDIVRGTEHPALKKWKGETNLGTLFAAGVLG